MVKSRPTQRQIAEEVGVSRTTVSLVLNDVPGTRITPETRQRILEVARRLNYYPDAAARTLVSGRTQTIGFVLCQSPDCIFVDAYLPEVLRGVGEVVQENGFRVLIHSVTDVTAPEAYIGLVREKHIDGIILSGPRSDDQQLPRLKAEDFPIVLLGQLPSSGIPFVDVDNVGAAKQAVEHLIELGHRRIGIITNAPLAYTAARDRLSGSRQAWEKQDWSTRRNWSVMAISRKKVAARRWGNCLTCHSRRRPSLSPATWWRLGHCWRSNAAGRSSPTTSRWWALTTCAWRTILGYTENAEETQSCTETLSHRNNLT